MLRMRRRTKRNIGIAVCVVAAGVGLMVTGGMVGGLGIKQEYEAVLKEQTLRLEGAKRLAYITTKNIKAGEVFTEENTECRMLLSEQTEEGLARDVLGKTACGELMSGVIINTAICGETNVAQSARECVFEDIEQAECFPEYTVVDVRIRYPNGENYCVLGRKTVRRSEGEEGCRLTLTEAEQLLVSGARYDRELYDGTVLYAVAFLEERLQTEADNRYIPSEQVIGQLEQCSEDTGVTAEWYKLRKALEQRLQRNKEQRETVD